MTETQNTEPRENTDRTRLGQAGTVYVQVIRGNVLGVYCASVGQHNSRESACYRAHALLAVSYTHLDVYKRQVMQNMSEREKLYNLNLNFVIAKLIFYTSYHGMLSFQTHTTPLPTIQLIMHVVKCRLLSLWSYHGVNCTKARRHNKVRASCLGEDDDDVMFFKSTFHSHVGGSCLVSMRVRWSIHEPSKCFV